MLKLFCKVFPDIFRKLNVKIEWLPNVIKYFAQEKKVVIVKSHCISNSLSSLESTINNNF